MSTSRLNVYAFGGGVQSNAVLVLQALRMVSFDVFIFANVGEDSENPATIDYVQSVSKPYALRHGIEFIELRKTRRNGETETLLEYIHRTARSVPIPARMANGAPGNRSCTLEFKIKVINRWLKQHGASVYNPACVGLGISMDEVGRMRTSSMPEQVNTYPLIDKRLTRNMCHTIIRDAGLPAAPKSSCFFCPFHSRYEWWAMKRNHPELFDQAVALEKFIQAKRIVDLYKDPLWLHADCQPLEFAVPDQLPLFVEPDDTCALGYCMV